MSSILPDIAPKRLPSLSVSLQAHTAACSPRSDSASRKLLEAASAGLADEVVHNLQASADPNATTTGTMSSLHLAAANDDATIVEILLDFGADPNIRSSMGWAPLHVAADVGAADACEALLMGGARPLSATTGGQTAADLALAAGHTALAHRLRFDSRAYAPLAAAAAGDTFGYVALARTFPSVPGLSATPLHIAAARGHFGVAVHLVRGGASLGARDSHGLTPFARAVRAQRLGMCELLLAVGASSQCADADLTPATTRIIAEAELYELHGAAILDDPDAVARVQARTCGQDPIVTTTGASALHWAAQFGCCNAAKLLVTSATINAPDNHRCTPLHMAAAAGCREMVRLLLDSGASKTAQNDLGFMPLHSAALSGHAHLIDMLWLETLPVDVASPLDLAIQGGHAEAAEILFNKGVKTSQGDFKKFTQVLTYVNACNSTVRLVKLLNSSQLAEAERTIAQQQFKGRIALRELLRIGDSTFADYFVGVCEQLPLHLPQPDLFMLAAQTGYVVAINALITRSIKPNCADADGRTPLHLAVLSGHAAAAEILAAFPEICNTTDREGKTALHYAVVQPGFSRTVEIMLQNGAKYQTKDNNGDTAFVLAAKRASPLVLSIFADFAALPGFKASVDSLVTNELLRRSCSTTERQVIIEIASGVPAVFAATRNNEIGLVRGYLHSMGPDCPDYPDQPILAALRLQNEPIALLLIQAGCSLKVKNKEGETPLHIAALRGMTRLCSEMLLRKADPHAKDAKGRTPLYCALSRSHVGIAEALLFAGAKMNARTKDGHTCLDVCNEMFVNKLNHDSSIYRLHGAVVSGRPELVRQCCEPANGKPASLEVLSLDGATPLARAIETHAPMEIIEILIQKGANVNVVSNNLLIQAIDAGLDEVALLFIESGARINSSDRYGTTPLHAAAHLGNMEILTELLEKGAELDAADEVGETPLITACTHKRVRAALALIEAGADTDEVDQDGLTALHHAHCDHSGRLAQKLLDHNAMLRVDEKGRTPLHLAAAEGAVAVVNVLIAANADVHACDNKGRTAMHYAAASLTEGAADVVRALANAGASVATRNLAGETCVHVAARTASETVEALVEAGADMGVVHQGRSPMITFAAEAPLRATRVPVDQLVAACTDAQLLATEFGTGASALHYAAMRGDVVLARALLDRGVPVDIRDGSQQTPLHWAAKKQARDVVQLLHSCGCDMNAVDADGCNAIDISRINHHFFEAIAPLLASLGTRVSSEIIKDAQWLAFQRSRKI